MLAKTLCFSAAFLSICSCTSAQTLTAPKVGQCPNEVESIFASIVGEWSLSIRADEGWTGYGNSSISWDADQKCGVIERSFAVFNQESETPSENRSTTYLLYDELSETIKVLTADTRGFVHIGIAAVEKPLIVDVLKPSGEASNRRIQYRNFELGSFEWSWQGRADVADFWHERLTKSYEKAR